MGCDEREVEIEMRSQKLANTNPIFYCISFSIKHLCDIFILEKLYAQYINEV